MQTIIITDNIRKADFVKKGLKYESLQSDVVTVENSGAVSHYASFYDGIFILSDNQEMIAESLNLCEMLGRELPVMVLTGSYSEILGTLKNRNILKSIFIRPFSFGTIAAEMRYHIFQMKEGEKESKCVLRDLELDLLRHEVKIGGQSVSLRHREFALLHFLMMNPGRVLSRTTILENVWDRNANITTNTVDVHISQLRKKLEKTTNQKYIYTIPCSGYLLS